MCHAKRLSKLAKRKVVIKHTTAHTTDGRDIPTLITFIKQRNRTKLTSIKTLEKNPDKTIPFNLTVTSRDILSLKYLLSLIPGINLQYKPTGLEPAVRMQYTVRSTKQNPDTIQTITYSANQQ